MTYPPPPEDPYEPAHFESGRAEPTQPQPSLYPPPGPPVPPRKSNRRLWVILGIVGGVLVLCCVGTTIVGLAAGGAKKTPTAATTTHVPATTAAPSPTPVATTKAAPAPTTAAATTQAAPPTGPKTLLTLKGNGIKKTQIFTTGDEWSVAYSYDCSAFGSKGNFIIGSYDSQGNPQDVLVNELQAKGSDTVPVHASPGAHYLEVNSECSWQITVTG